MLDYLKNKFAETKRRKEKAAAERALLISRIEETIDAKYRRRLEAVTGFASWFAGGIYGGRIFWNSTELGVYSGEDDSRLCIPWSSIKKATRLGESRLKVEFKQNSGKTAEVTFDSIFPDTNLSRYYNRKDGRALAIDTIYAYWLEWQPDQEPSYSTLARRLGLTLSPDFVNNITNKYGAEALEHLEREIPGINQSA